MIANLINGMDKDQLKKVSLNDVNHYIEVLENGERTKEVDGALRRLYNRKIVIEGKKSDSYKENRASRQRVSGRVGENKPSGIRVWRA